MWPASQTPSLCGLAAEADAVAQVPDAHQMRPCRALAAMPAARASASFMTLTGTSRPSALSAARERLAHMSTLSAGRGSGDSSITPQRTMPGKPAPTESDGPILRAAPQICSRRCGTASPPGQRLEVDMRLARLGVHTDVTELVAVHDSGPRCTAWPALRCCVPFVPPLRLLRTASVC